MDSDKKKLSLIGYLAIMPVARVTERGVFGGSYIRLIRILHVSWFLYETAAIIGRAMSDKILILAKMLAFPRKEQAHIEFLQELAKQRLESYGKEPNTFYELFINTQLMRAGLRLDFSKEYQKAMAEKVPLSEAEPMIKLWVSEGIGFGSKFPDLTVKMWRREYETDTTAIRKEMKKCGVNILEHPPKITFEEQEQEILSLLAEYVQEYFPELIISLGLQKYQISK